MLEEVYSRKRYMRKIERFGKCEEVSG